VLAAAAFMRYRVFTFSEKAESGEPARRRLSRRPRLVSVSRSVQPPVRMPELVNLSVFPRAARWIRSR
jgi:hypothetical protein